MDSPKVWSLDPLDPADEGTPKYLLAQALRELCVMVTATSLRAYARESHVDASVVSKALKGKEIPRWDFVRELAERAAADRQEFDQTVLLSAVDQNGSPDDDTELLYLDGPRDAREPGPRFPVGIVEALHVQLQERDNQFHELMTRFKLVEEENKELRRSQSRRPAVEPARHRRPGPAASELPRQGFPEEPSSGWPEGVAVTDGVRGYYQVIGEPPLELRDF